MSFCLSDATIAHYLLFLVPSETSHTNFKLSTLFGKALNVINVFPSLRYAFARSDILLYLSFVTNGERPTLHISSPSGILLHERMSCMCRNALFCVW